MTSYALEYTDGRVNDIVADSDHEAIAIVLARFDDMPGSRVISEDWDNAGNEDGRRRERLLIWESEADAEGDDGSHAIAQITALRPAE